MKKKILIRGPVLTMSGYGVHARQVARYFLNKQSDYEVFFNATPWGVTPWLLDCNDQNGFIGEIMKRTVPEMSSADVSIQVQLPNEWDPKLAKYNVGITAGVETDRCNPQWIDCCNRMNMVIVPSQHTKNTLKNSGNLITQLNVVPESFIDSTKKQSIPDLPVNWSTNFNFLVFGQITGTNPMNDRKNLFTTIKWLCEAFSNDKDVGIIVKTNNGKNSAIDRQMTTELLKNLLKEVRKTDFPRIHFLHGEMSDDEVVALYRHPTVKALVTLTRGEGFGLPILEAAANGLPVIATGWSGHLDFMNTGKYVNLSYDLLPIHKSRIDNSIFVENSRWAEVNEFDFKKKIIKFRSNNDIPKQWANDLRSKLLESHSFEAISKYYDDVFKDLI